MILLAQWPNWWRCVCCVCVRKFRFDALQMCTCRDGIRGIRVCKPHAVHTEQCCLLLLWLACNQQQQKGTRVILRLWLFSLVCVCFTQSVLWSRLSGQTAAEKYTKHTTQSVSAAAAAKTLTVSHCNRLHFGCTSPSRPHGESGQQDSICA